jgi:hypothetical protein
VNYQVIQPPFSLKFNEMTKDDVRQYFHWFMGIMPERLETLGRAVRDTPGYQDQVLDGSPQSLIALGAWFEFCVEARSRTKAELAEVQSRSKHPMGIVETELTDRTFSIAFDVAIYFVKAMVQAHPHLKWEQPLKDKRFIDYGQPVLVGLGPVPLNPVRLMINLAYGFASKSTPAGRLAEIFDIWSAKAPVNPAPSRA